MANQNKRWLADFRVESELKLIEGKEKLVYNHPDGIYEIHLSNASDQKQKNEILSIQVIAPIEDMTEAEILIEEYLHKFLHMMSLVTSTGYKSVRKVCLIDWTEGLGMRDAYIYTKQSPDKPLSALSDTLIDTIKILHTGEKDQTLESALRWYALGVRAKIMEDQFQFFWFVIEVIAANNKDSEKVADKCPTCRGDLYCESCNKTPMHKPYKKQAIESLLQNMKLTTGLIDILFEVRNSLMHGKYRESIETEIKKKEPNFTFDKTVDIIEKTSWQAIFANFKIPKPAGGDEYPEFGCLSVSTYVDYNLTAKAHIQTVVGGELKIENLQLPKIWIGGKDDEP